MNDSKKQDPRFALKWWRSGAIRQPKFPPGALKVVAIGIAREGGVVVYKVLSLGEKVVYAGPDGSTVTSVYYAVVTPDQHFELGQVLDKLPGNAVPAEVFEQAGGFAR